MDPPPKNMFYQENNIPTSPFHLIEKKEDLNQYADFLPFVQKMGKEGYDGNFAFY